jgi:pyridoxine 5-phosphate synthase
MRMIELYSTPSHRLGLVSYSATIRQARYRGEDVLSEPDPVLAAHQAELGGADIITIHLREDRRHIQDRDLELLSRTVRAKLNLEMAATDEMVGIALKHKSAVQLATLVPEGRQELTTEGGLDVKGNAARMKEVVKKLRDGGISVSAFIDPVSPQIDAARKAGFQVCELHTGAYARAYAKCGGDILCNELGVELGSLVTAGAQVAAAGMRFNAGHALNYFNVVRIAALPGICELHIGHAIVSRAVFVGLRAAVREMKDLMVKAHHR